MPSIRSLLSALALTSALVIGSSSAGGQNSKSVRQVNASGSAPLLRTIVVRHPGCLSCNDEIISREQDYLNERVKDRPTVESVYDQKKVDDMAQALEDFWKQRGIAVEVSPRLTQVCSTPSKANDTNAPCHAILEFNVYRTF